MNIETPEEFQHRCLLITNHDDPHTALKKLYALNLMRSNQLNAALGQQWGIAKSPK